MTTKILLRSCAAVLALCGLAPAVQAAEPAPAAVTRPKMEFGFEQRVRFENFDNVTDWNDARDDERSHYRWRSRLWASIPLGEGYTVAVGISNESRKITSPDTPYHWDETFVETAYVDARLAPGATVRVGRQNVTRGEGFLLIDGSPLDGSRSFYVNGAVVGLSFGGGRFDLLALDNPREDHRLPRFDDGHKALAERHERAYGAYWTRPAAGRAPAWEAYWLVKDETDDARAVTSPAYRPDRRLHTVGGRLVQALGHGWSVTGEAALQRGHQDGGTAIRGFGGYAYLRKSFDHPWKPALQTGYTYLSGDDPGTAGKDEGWDPLFSRYPKWSDLMIYAQVTEHGVSYWTNTALWQFEATATPARWLSGRATWYRVDAPERFPGNPAVFGRGSRRGNLFETRLDVAAGSHWKGHLQGERLAPGAFYASDDAAWFLRAEVIYTFKLTR